jgi:hypothetical protein
MSLLALASGVVLAALVFAALVWSGWRAASGAGWARRGHGAVAVLILSGAVALTWEWPAAAQAAGAGLVVAGLLALWHERGWARALVAVAIGFGALLASGLLLAPA